MNRLPARKTLKNSSANNLVISLNMCSFVKLSNNAWCIFQMSLKFHMNAARHFN